MGENQKQNQSNNRIILFFDECVKPPDNCIDGCQDNNKSSCKHRLDFPAEILGINGYIRFMHFSDRQIILHCFFMIKNNTFLSEISKLGNFYLVTKDKNFLKDAQKENRPKRRSRKTTPIVGFGPDYVECSGFKIKVLKVNCKSKTKFCDGLGDNDCSICRLNNFWQTGKIKL